MQHPTQHQDLGKPRPRDKRLRKDSRGCPGLETCLRLGDGGDPDFYKM